jgi:hypothetical protein
MVSVRSVPLFAAGDRAGQEAEISLRRLPGDHQAVAVAVLADGVSATGPISLLSVPQPRLTGYRVRAKLEGPGRIRFTEPSDVIPEPRPWSELMTGLPTRVEVQLGPIDLVCAMELAGERDLVRRRRDLVRKLLETLEAECPEPGRLRVALASCSDHLYEPGREALQVVRTTSLLPTGQALAILGKEPGSEVHSPKSAPLEDLLHEAAELLACSRAARRAPLVLLVAGRPPHPSRLEDNVHPCPRRLDWRAELQRLSGQHRARCVTVADVIPPRQAQAAVWHQLGPAGLHELDRADSRQIGEDLGILVRDTQRLPIPLADPEAGRR